MLDKKEVEVLQMCKKCGEDKPLSQFNKDPKKLSKHSSTCKLCISERNKLNRAEKLAELNQFY